MLDLLAFAAHPDDVELSCAGTMRLAKFETRDEKGNPQEPHRPMLELNFMQTYTFEPRIVIDVSDVFEDRMKTMDAFGSQFFGSVVREKSEKETFLSQAHFFDWLRARAGYFGMMIGVQYGEPFWSHEPLGTKDLFSLVTKRVA
jgi:LmbE family N-acetylglucosaminyl deacetylase